VDGAAGTSLLTGATKVAASWDAKAKVNGTADFGTTVKGFGTAAKNKWADWTRNPSDPSAWGDG
jgi:hypothetical protein